jgi:hypothetical protein
MVAAHLRFDDTHAIVGLATGDDLQEKVARVRGVRGKG